MPFLFRRLLVALSLLVMGSWEVWAQNYLSYFTGDTADVVRPTQPGWVLMGGSTENDSAMVWWLRRSGGGDVLVIRASGSDGYNDYLYQELGQSVNSVETLVFQNREASFDPYVIRRLAEAEAIWIAGGDQARYVNYWRNSPIDSLLNRKARIEGVPIGGTSAGMAIMGSVYFAAFNGSVTSAEALSNPYGSRVTLGRDDFLHLPFLENTVTDTHFDNPDRRGRLTAFLARLYADSGRAYRAIASEERTAVCVDTSGLARVFGTSPNADFAYFVQVNCAVDSGPEQCAPNLPLTWNRNNQALSVYRVPGTPSGLHRFQLRTWKNGQGGSWQNWYAESGSFGSAAGTLPDCLLSSVEETVSEKSWGFYPNPAKDRIRLEEGIRLVSLADLQGKVYRDDIEENGELRNLPPGIYFLVLENRDGLRRIQKLVLEP